MNPLQHRNLAARSLGLSLGLVGLVPVFGQQATQARRSAMHAIPLTLTVVGPSAGNDTKAPVESTPAAIRVVDLNGDGLLDRLQVGADGALSVALNRGGRQFEEIVQALPAIDV